jgi:hypothetical protein
VENPAYIPTPKALTERFPWLIYAVLVGVSLVLAALIAGLGKSALARHDGRAAAGS